jgi:hypothetical protein
MSSRPRHEHVLGQQTDFLNVQFVVDTSFLKGWRIPGPSDRDSLVSVLPWLVLN